MNQMRTTFAILVLVAVSDWAATQLGEKLSIEAMNGLARGQMAMFTLLIGFSSFMLKEVQSLEPKDALSELALERLRSVQSIASHRLLWMIACGIIGFCLAAICSFSTGELGELSKLIAFPIAFAFLTILIAFTIGYLPRLYFDLKSARESLADIIRSNESRKDQLSILAGKEN